MKWFFRRTFNNFDILFDALVIYLAWNKDWKFIFAGIIVTMISVYFEKKYNYYDELKGASMYTKQWVINELLDAIDIYKEQDPMTAETLARIEELEWAKKLVGCIREEYSNNEKL